MVTKLHENELRLSDSLVLELVKAQFPRLSELPLKRVVTSGSSNVLYRLGNELLVRLPRQLGGGSAIAKEIRWLPYIAQHIPASVPEVVDVGEPCESFPERWSILRWQAGESPQLRSTHPTQLGELLAAFKATPIPSEARADESLRTQYRGHALAEYDQQMHRNIDACRYIEGLGIDLDHALELWERAVELNANTQPLAWFHGDIVAENLLTQRSKLVALIDFGGLGIGDPTVDLHGAWELLDAAGRTRLRKMLNVDDAQWLRGRAWGLAIALMTFPYYWSSLPRRVADRLVMVREVLADNE